MNFELKKVKYSPSLSEETNAFTAEVWLDGKKVGYASNRGHGGNTDVDLELPRRSEILDWVSKQPAKVYAASEGMKEFSVPYDMEVVVDDLMEKWLDEKYGEGAQKKKWCKKQVVFRLKGDKAGSYRTLKKDALTGTYSKRQKEYLVKTHGDKIEEIINETLGEIPQ
jgi:hypothetical protein